MWRKIGIGVLVLLLIVGGVVGLRWLVSDPLQQQTSEAVNLEDEWANTIRKIGIEPVFPPEEDLTVGDVLAVVVKDNKPDEDTDDTKITAQTPLPKRAVKLAHIDVREALTRNYAKLPIFIAPNELAAAAAQAVGDNSPAKQPGNADAPAAKPESDGKAAAARRAADGKVLPGVARDFMQETNQSNLPRAAFPKLKIQGSASASSGLGATLRGFVGYATGNTGLEELFLTEVRTYGLPSSDAADLLKGFCTAAETKNVCLDASARQQLERTVGDDKDGTARIYQKYISDKKGSQRYRIRIDIVMVNRVYLARAIRNLNQSGSAEGARVTVTVQPGAEPPARADNAAPPPNPDRVELEAMRKRLEELEKQSSGTTGASAAYGRSRDREALLNEAFDRPVAIGYRSVRFLPDGVDESE
jgi:hypothetical protein